MALKFGIHLILWYP